MEPKINSRTVGMTSHNARYISPTWKKPYRGISRALIYVRSGGGGEGERGSYKTNYRVVRIFTAVGSHITLTYDHHAAMIGNSCDLGDGPTPGQIRSFSPYRHSVPFTSHNVSYNGRENAGLSVPPPPPSPRQWFFRVNDNFGRFENHKFWPRRRRSSAVDEGTIYHQSRRIDATLAPLFFLLRRVRLATT